ncbi:HNH endonuclease [Verminephrobacter aporrectodeae subsp. tuberculatae]|uniref:HNH endonuclease n=1 Tax=Verminephrobacter aporrectodeae TaxID=1110389 RepID=UPI002237BBE3|nr:HNH endonuclease [Verminephrobacter aporrectodeae]MCW5255376.1 HNH endonuclease [Verminephrobacter aporrectodeae subsp. tuberculatae]
MRPVERGAWPQDDAGANIQFTEYTQARRELISRMGEYCSYCEMRLGAALAVEHIQPKKPPNAATVDRGRELSWDNFLLACTNCNSSKGSSDVNLDDYIWPDRDNTFRAIKYAEGGLVSIVPGVAEVAAKNTIRLVGLDKTPDTSEASDRRWNNRREAWEMAVNAKNNLLGCNTDAIAIKRLIIDLAISKGFWSTWMTVFMDDPDMLQRLINALPGTSKTCFDASLYTQAPEHKLCYLFHSESTQ